MTGLLLLGLVGGGILVLWAIAALLDTISEDTDLQAPWSPGDPPDYRKRPCGVSSCRIDHSKVNPWVEDRQR